MSTSLCSELGSQTRRTFAAALFTGKDPSDTDGRTATSNRLTG